MNSKFKMQSAKCKVQNAKYCVRIIVILIAVTLITFIGNTLHAEEKGEEKKITIEKTEVLGVLERPAVIFPVRWKYPEGLQTVTVIPDRNFKKEIFEFVDMETIRQEGLWE